MSVRSTNVYEEQSLGIYAEEESNKEPTFDAESAPRLSVLSQYTVMHVQKQLAFGTSLDIRISWYLIGVRYVVAGLIAFPHLHHRKKRDRGPFQLFLVHYLQYQYVSTTKRIPADILIHDAVFELVSAYANVGLSLGMPHVRTCMV